MKQVKYFITLSDGTKLEQTANNAGEAIEAARRSHRGRCVVKCHSGLTEQQAEDLRAVGVKAMAGLIQHEIPEHSAYDEYAVFDKRAPKVDLTEAMFSEAEIKAESEAALNRRRV